MPINLFGGMTTATPEAAKCIRDDYKIASQWIEQTVGELSLSGDLGFGLPAGDILHRSRCLVSQGRAESADGDSGRRISRRSPTAAC